MKTKRKGTFAVLLLLVLLVGLGGYAAYRLAGSRAAYAQGDQVYAQLQQQVAAEPDRPDGSADSAQSDPATRQVDFAALQALNPDGVAWLYCPGTPIDYPVMAAADYDEYLRYLPDGSYNINGSLFLDPVCQGGFSQRLTVIYGHHMKSGKMFGTLCNYKEQSYFDQHPDLYLYTPDQTYRIALLYGAVVSVDEWLAQGYVQDADGLLAYEAAHTTFVSPAEYTGAEQLVALSTCSYEYEGARYVVLGLLEPI
jgi:sortase B